MPPISYLLTLHVTVTTTASAKSMKILGHSLQITIILCDKWQHHSWL